MTRVSLSGSRRLACGLLGLLIGCATPPRSSSVPVAQFVLRAEQTAQLNSPAGRRFDASGLLITAGGELLTLHDKRPTLYRILYAPGSESLALELVTNCFNAKQLSHLAGEKQGPYDSEGIAQDGQGRLYICEEGNRWILRFDPKLNAVERLPIDWSPVEEFFSKQDRNASFEGVAIGKGKLYVANERSAPVIIVVDLNTLKVVDHFAVYSLKTSLPSNQQRSE